MTPSPDPDPEPTNPTVTLSITQSWGNNATTWLQSGNSWGDGIVSGSSTTENNGTHEFTCPAGDYYLFTAPTGTSGYYVTMKVNGTTVSNGPVTNGTLSGYRSSSKITISADATLTVIIEKP